MHLASPEPCCEHVQVKHPVDLRTRLNTCQGTRFACTWKGSSKALPGVQMRHVSWSSPANTLGLLALEQQV